MREDKCKRLATKGWTNGSAAQFLGLSADEERYVELRLRLSGGLRRRRQNRQIRQSELARALRSS